jgi:uncharacterized coiled-coil protein SlyX
MGQDEDQAIRDRLKELEIQQRFQERRLDAMEKALAILQKAIWSAPVLASLFVLNQVFEMISGGGGK